MGRIRDALDRAIFAAADGGPGQAAAGSRAYQAAGYAARLATDSGHSAVSTVAGIAAMGAVLAVEHFTPEPSTEDVQYATFTTDTPRRGRR